MLMLMLRFTRVCLPMDIETACRPMTLFFIDVVMISIATRSRHCITLPAATFAIRQMPAAELYNADALDARKRCYDVAYAKMRKCSGALFCPGARCNKIMMRDRYTTR